jgi:hypothetical protein
MEIVMQATEKHANNSSSDASHNLASQPHLTDGPPSDERIRERAYELYIERGSLPGDGIGDWLQAEREYYGQP